MRGFRALGAFAVLVAALALMPAAVAAQTCTSPSGCAAPGATPLPSIAVEVESPAPSLPVRTDDVLSRPPSIETASVLPSLAVVGGVLLLIVTLASIVRRRTLAKVPTPAPEPAPVRTEVRARVGAVRHVGVESHWDIDSVERAAAGLKPSG